MSRFAFFLFSVCLSVRLCIFSLVISLFRFFSLSVSLPASLSVSVCVRLVNTRSSQTPEDCPAAELEASAAHTAANATPVAAALDETGLLRVLLLSELPCTKVIILAEGAMTLPVTLSGGVLFAS